MSLGTCDNTQSTTSASATTVPAATAVTTAHAEDDEEEDMADDDDEVVEIIRIPTRLRRTIGMVTRSRPPVHDVLLDTGAEVHASPLPLPFATNVRPVSTVIAPAGLDHISVRATHLCDMGSPHISGRRKINSGLWHEYYHVSERRS